METKLHGSPEERLMPNWTGPEKLSQKNGHWIQLFKTIQILGSLRKSSQTRKQESYQRGGMSYQETSGQWKLREGNFREAASPLLFASSGPICWCVVLCEFVKFSTSQMRINSAIFDLKWVYGLWTVILIYSTGKPAIGKMRLHTYIIPWLTPLWTQWCLLIN